jgi:hypothetical protein
MRHDTHFVDQLARPGGEAIGRLIPVEDIEPNPDQPRQALGDLAELTASIREKGILEPARAGSEDARSSPAASLPRSDRGGPRRGSVHDPRGRTRR